MGLYATVLSIGAGNGLMLAGALTRASGNRLANRILAALIGLVILRVSIYILGYSGAYDRWRWLTFCPLDWSFAFGPLFWGYAVSLTHSRLPSRFTWHFVPAILQAAYQSICFLLPMDDKWNIYTGADRLFVGPTMLALMLLQQGIYIVAAIRSAKPYAERPWLIALIGGFGVQWILSVLFALYGWSVRPLSYVERFPIMVGYCLWIYALGLLGWRYGAVASRAPRASTGRTPQSYEALAEGWRVRIAQGQWWREEGLTLATVASRLNVSERTLSRGLSEGLGESFTGLINRLRVEDVILQIESQGGDDFLGLAHDAGFSSKASFNRAFRAATGLSPSAFRKNSRRTFRQKRPPTEGEATV